MGLVVDVVVKHGTLGWELDGLELSRPPFGELYTVVNQLETVKIVVLICAFNRYCNQLSQVWFEK